MNRREYQTAEDAIIAEVYNKLGRDAGKYDLDTLAGKVLSFDATKCVIYSEMTDDDFWSYAAECRKPVTMSVAQWARNVQH